MEAWGSACETNLDRLKILQNKAVRILTGNKYFQVFGETPGPLPSADPLFKELKILKFNDIFKMIICKFVYLTLCNQSPSPFTDWFIYNHLVHDHATSSSSNISQAHYFDVGIEQPTYTLYVKKYNLFNYGKKMIKTLGPLIWNDLPPNIHDETSIHTFKIHLKKNLIGKYDQ